MLERDVERYLIQQVRSQGGEVRKVQWLGRRGAPDRLVLLPGRQLWVELKRPGGKPDAHQEREIARLRAWGCEVVVINSREAVDETLAGAGADGEGSRAGRRKGRRDPTR